MEEPVKFLDLSRENGELALPMADAVDRVARSGHALYGPELEAFESGLAAWFGVKHAVGVASGTDAVEIALRCVGARSVFCPAFTAIPCANAIEAAGAQIELVEVNANGNTAALSHEGPEALLTVSMFGAAAWLDDGEYDCKVIEDIAHAMGARDHGGRLVGTRGVAGAVSFYPTKILGAVGDGGAIITNEDGIAARARQIRHYGVESPGVTVRGQNSRLSEVQAAILRLKLPRVWEWIAARRRIARRYCNELRNATVVQPFAESAGNVYHVFVVRHPERDRVRKALAERGVPTMVHYERAIHEHPRWAHLGYPGEFPMAEKLAREVISLPCYPYLTAAEQDRVIAAWNEVA